MKKVLIIAVVVVMSLVVGIISIRYFPGVQGQTGAMDGAAKMAGSEARADARVENHARTEVELKEKVRNIGEFEATEDYPWIIKAYRALDNFATVRPPCEVSVKREEGRIRIVFRDMQYYDDIRNGAPNNRFFDDTIGGAVIDLQTGEVIFRIGPQ